MVGAMVLTATSAGSVQSPGPTASPQPVATTADPSPGPSAPPSAATPVASPTQVPTTPVPGLPTAPPLPPPEVDATPSAAPTGPVPTIPAVAMPPTPPAGAGTLTIEQPSSVSATGAAGSTVEVEVSGIVISDDRGGPPVFTATVTASPLVGAATTVPASAMTWTTTAVTTPDGQPLPGLAGQGGPMDGPAVIAVGPGTEVGTDTVVVSGVLTIPASSLAAGEYQLALTTSIS